jgi:hypothetical protein
MTGVLYFDFAWFREQTCLVACPYGRLQSALIDRDSILIGYDAKIHAMTVTAVLRLLSLDPKPPTLDPQPSRPLDESPRSRQPPGTNPPHRPASRRPIS